MSRPSSRSASILGLLLAGPACLFAADPPHNIATTNAYGSSNYCTTCHKVMGGASGASLTVQTDVLNVRQGPGTNYQYFAFNLDDPVFRDRRVRRSAEWKAALEIVQQRTLARVHGVRTRSAPALEVLLNLREVVEVIVHH